MNNFIPRYVPSVPPAYFIVTMTRSPVKVFVYITHSGELGDRLLIFSHPDFPEAGIQVPAGTVEPGEDLQTAAMREAYEETGLIDLKYVGFLGSCIYDMSAWGGNLQQHRYFFHLMLEGRVPEMWRHQETSGGQREPIVFEFFWAALPNSIPDLIAGHGQMLPALLSQQYQNCRVTLYLSS